MSGYNYDYFSGANVTVHAGLGKIVECAGISYSVQTSQQPVYGYNSVFFDVMLPGRVIVQGSLVVNYTQVNSLEKVIYGTDGAGLNKYNGGFFNIDIKFGDPLGGISAAKTNETIIDCTLISSGKTVQISEQVILEEYSFIGRAVVPTSSP